MQHDTIYKNSILRDTFYLHEREQVRHDTVFRDRSFYHLRTLLDTVQTVRFDSVPYPVVQTVTKSYTPAFYRWCTGILITLILLALIYAAVRIYLRMH